ncbi:MAG: hypothetical protein JWQ08_2624, partial [Deinococcus sp.]|nr:hypothetical protein [Deinococcus sp.]
SLAETLTGRMVLSVGSHRTPDAEALAHLSSIEQTETVARLSVLHRHKIELADEILIINVGGYVGESTRAEVIYAQRQGKRVRYLEVLALD